MCEVLMEIMKDDIDKKVAEGMAEGREEGRAEGRITESVVIYRDEMNMDDSSIFSKIRDKFGLTQELAEKYVLAER